MQKFGLLKWKSLWIGGWEETNLIKGSQRDQKISFDSHGTDGWKPSNKQRSLCVTGEGDHYPHPFPLVTDDSLSLLRFFLCGFSLSNHQFNSSCSLCWNTKTPFDGNIMNPEIKVFGISNLPTLLSHYPSILSVSTSFCETLSVMTIRVFLADVLLF